MRYYNILEEIPNSGQIRAARGLMDLTQAKLAKLSGISLSSLKKYENLNVKTPPVTELRYLTIKKLVEFLEENGVAFVSDPSSYGVYIQNDFKNLGSIQQEKLINFHY